MKLKVAEIFYSLQGEGRYLGVPSVFLRVFGCNFKCEGFGMPKGKKSYERIEIASNGIDYQKYTDLPLVHTGCDSYASWDPAFKHLSPVLETEAVVNAIVDLLPQKTWKQEHLVVTGGEPLLGWQRAYPELLSHPRMTDLRELTFETNGSQPLSDDFHRFLRQSFHWECLTFSVSPKLSISGEKWEEAIQPANIIRYQEVGFTYLKFVVATEDDVKEAETAVEQYKMAGFYGPVYLMPEGGTNLHYDPNHKKVAEWAMKRGWRYSPRLQVELWKNAWGT